MSRASVFESAGLLSSCSECGHAILCGVLHSGSCNRHPLGETDEDIDPRAERPLMFRSHELVSDMLPIAADHAMVTFLHCCRAGGGNTALISRDWEKHMLPYAISPGIDVGIGIEDHTREPIPHSRRMEEESVGSRSGRRQVERRVRL